MADMKRMDVKVLGISIGDAQSWDQLSDRDIVFNDYRPNIEGIKFLGVASYATIEGLVINFEDGVVEVDGVQVYPDWSVFNQKKTDIEEL